MGKRRRTVDKRYSVNQLTELLHFLAVRVLIVLSYLCRRPPRRTACCPGRESNDPDWAIRPSGNIAAVSRIVFLFFLLDLEFWLFCTKNRYFYTRLTCIYKNLSVRPVLGSFESFEKINRNNLNLLKY